MPRASRHEETGWLNERAGALFLRRDGGGCWRLDCGGMVRWRSRGLLGRRVRVVGRRDDFDLLAVSRIEPIG